MSTTVTNAGETMQPYTDNPADIHDIDAATLADLIGVAEIAERLTGRAGVTITRSNVSTWINRRITQDNQFPRPLTDLAMGGLYSWVDIAAWWDSRKGRALTIAEALQADRAAAAVTPIAS